jgi:hypothetical protein
LTRIGRIKTDQDSVHSPNPALRRERRVIILALAGAPNPSILPILLYDASGVLSSWRLQGTIDLTTHVSPVVGQWMVYLSQRSEHAHVRTDRAVPVPHLGMLHSSP